jgi:hypothetical protein
MNLKLLTAMAGTSSYSFFTSKIIVLHTSTPSTCFQCISSADQHRLDVHSGEYQVVELVDPPPQLRQPLPVRRDGHSHYHEAQSDGPDQQGGGVVAVVRCDEVLVS